MNFVSQFGIPNVLEGPNSGHPTLASTQSRQRRHTIVDHVFLRTSTLSHQTLSQQCGLNEIHMDDLARLKHEGGGGGRRHSRNPSNVTGCPSITTNSNNNLKVGHGDDLDNNNGAGDHLVPLISDNDLLHVQEDQDHASSYGNTVMEELPSKHDCETEGCQRVVINVSGLKFETQLRTLERLPNTLLGDPAKRSKFWDGDRQEFFFDRHRPTFQAVLYYYQSGGKLKRPLEVPMDIFLNELHFYELGEYIMEVSKRNEGYMIDEPEVLLPDSTWKRRIWEMLEYPESSLAAKVFAVFSICFILISVVTFCVETLPQFKEKGCVNATVELQDGSVQTVPVTNWLEPLFIIESSCIAFFVLELVSRVVVSPSKVQFLKTAINWIDLVAIAPYFIFLFLNATGRCGEHTSSFISVLRVLRVIRIFKLSKHSQGLKVLGKTLKTSIRELGMFLLFMGIATVIYSGAIFYAELGQDNSMFVSIPDAFWWAIVTMTTVGYGDYVPVGVLGKVLGGFCVLSGVLAIALPVPVIVANFNTYYRHYTGRGVCILI